MGIRDTVLLCAALTWSMFKAIINLATEKKRYIACKCGKISTHALTFKKQYPSWVDEQYRSGEASLWLLLSLHFMSSKSGYFTRATACVDNHRLCYIMNALLSKILSERKKMKLIFWGSLGIRLPDLFLSKHFGPWVSLLCL